MPLSQKGQEVWDRILEVEENARQLGKLMEQLYIELEQAVMLDARVQKGDTVSNPHGVFTVAGIDNCNLESEFGLEQPALNGYTPGSETLKVILPPWKVEPAEKDSTT